MLLGFEWKCYCIAVVLTTIQVSQGKCDNWLFPLACKICWSFKGHSKSCYSQSTDATVKCCIYTCTIIIEGLFSKNAI